MAGTGPKKGIDVSRYQGNIDWNKVNAAGIKFAMIRIGFRGYKNGKISIDSRFTENITGAERAGVPVGGYFFSTAIDEEEARKEAQYCIGKLSSHRVSLPVVYDFEGYNNPEYRTYGMTREQRTACCQAFISAVEAAGYRSMLYGSRGNIRTTYDIDALHYPLWVARYSGGYKKILDDQKYFPGIPGYDDRIAMWQYTSIGRVDGISGNVDLDFMYFNPAEKPVQEEPKPIPAPSAGRADIIYRVKTAGGRWLPEVINNEGHAGNERQKIIGFMAKISDGTPLSYRAHTVAGRWLGWVGGYDENDFRNGYAGDNRNAIDALEIRCGKYTIVYKVSPASFDRYYAEVTDETLTGPESYAGVFGHPIDKVMCWIK